MQSSGVRRKLSMIAKGGGAPLCSSKKVLGVVEMEGNSRGLGGQLCRVV